MTTADQIALIAIAIYLASMMPVLTWLLAHYQQRPNCEPRTESSWLRRLFGCTDQSTAVTAG